MEGSGAAAVQPDTQCQYGNTKQNPEQKAPGFAGLLFFGIVSKPFYQAAV
ncbi:MAG: hypothetical protein ACI3WQ_00230 [Faecousia sp.]